MKRLVAVVLCICFLVSPTSSFATTGGVSVAFATGSSPEAGTESTLVFKVPLETRDKYIEIDLGNSGFTVTGFVGCVVDSWQGAVNLAVEHVVIGNRVEIHIKSALEYASSVDVSVSVRNPLKAGRVPTIGMVLKVGVTQQGAVRRPISNEFIEVRYTVRGARERVIAWSQDPLPMTVEEGGRLVTERLVWRVLRANRLVAQGVTTTGKFDVLTHFYTDPNRYSADYVVEVFRESDPNTRGSFTFKVVYDLQVTGIAGLKLNDSSVISGTVRDALGRGVPNVAISLSKKVVGGWGGGTPLASRNTGSDGSFALLGVFTDACYYVLRVGNVDYLEFGVQGVGIDVLVEPAVVQATAAGSEIRVSAKANGVEYSGDAEFRVISPSGKAVIDWPVKDEWGWYQPKPNTPQVLKLPAHLAPGTYTVEGRWDDQAAGNSTDIYDRTGSTTFTVRSSQVTVEFRNMSGDRVALGENEVTVTAADSHGRGFGLGLHRVQYTITGPFGETIVFDSSSPQAKFEDTLNTRGTHKVFVESGGEIVVAGKVTLGNGNEEEFSFAFVAQGLEVRSAKLLGEAGQVVTLRAEAIRLDGLPANNLKIMWISSRRAFAVRLADGSWSEPVERVEIDGVRLNILNGVYETEVKLLRKDSDVEVVAVYSLLSTQRVAAFKATIAGPDVSQVVASPATLTAAVPGQAVKLSIVDYDGRPVTELAQLEFSGAGVREFFWQPKGPNGVYEYKLTPRATGQVEVLALSKDKSTTYTGIIKVERPEIVVQGDALTEHMFREVRVSAGPSTELPFHVRVRMDHGQFEARPKGNAVNMGHSYFLHQRLEHLFDLNAWSNGEQLSARVYIDVSFVKDIWVNVGELPVRPMDIRLSQDQVNAFTETRLTVQVLNAQGIPIVGKVVQVIGGSGITNSDGKATLTVRPPATGEYLVQVATDRLIDGKVVYAEKRIRSVLDANKPDIRVEVQPTSKWGVYLVTGRVTDDVGVRSASVQGKPVVLGATGEFAVEVALPTGTHEIVVKALDISGNEAEVVLTVLVPQQVWVIPLGQAKPEIGLDQPPVVMNGRTMLPFRWFGEQVLGAEVGYRVAGGAEIVSLTRGDTRVELYLNTTGATVNGRLVALDVPTIALQGRTLVPARFLAETFGFSIVWEPRDNSIVISRK